jgi:hypothetical protein
MRAGAVALALVLLGCGGGRDAPRVFQCTRDSPVRVCQHVCREEPCFQRERAHCFRNGPDVWCHPSSEECLDYSRVFREIFHSEPEHLPCRELRADEVAP